MPTRTEPSAADAPEGPGLAELPRQHRSVTPSRSRWLAAATLWRATSQAASSSRSTGEVDLATSPSVIDWAGGRGGRQTTNRRDVAGGHTLAIAQRSPQDWRASV